MFKKGSGKFVHKKGLVDTLDYPKIVFQHIDRMSASAIELRADSFKQGVRFLEGLLSPVRDDEYKKEFTEAEEKLKEEKKKARTLPNAREAREVAEQNHIFRRFEALMKLMSRYGLLPQEVGEYDERY